jgi:RNA polymerase sigma factor (sigma-70 family)
LRVAFWILRDEPTAQDAVQETFERAWRSRSTLKDSDPGPWLTRICVNRCLTLRRRLLARKTVALGDSVAAQSRTPNLDLDRAYLSLSPRQRAVISLHYRFGFPLDEVAVLMTLQPGTVRSHLARALAKLREGLADG